MPYSYAYIRCSSEEQKKSGLGVEAQEDQIRSLHRLYCEEPPWGEHCHEHDEPGFFTDLAVSAYKKEWTERPGASALLKILQPGDVIHFAKVDRAFRSTFDFATTIRKLDALNVSMRFADINVDSKTPTGRALLEMLVVWAQWESAIKGVRVREALAAKHARNGTGAVPPEKQNRKKTIHKSATEKPAEVAVPIPYCDTPEEEKFLMRAGKVHCYVRCSHEDQVASGLGLESQKAAAERYITRLMDMNPLLERGGVFTDAGISAFTKRLSERQQGKVLCETVQPGDHVVFLRMDRAFRNTIDMRVTLDLWRGLGVTMHFSDQMLDLSSPMGVMFATTLVMFAELESSMNSARTKAGLDMLKKRGLRTNFEPPIGFMLVKDHAGFQRLVLDRPHVAVMKLTAHLKRIGMDEKSICMHIENLMAKRLGYEPVKTYGGEVWPEHTFKARQYLHKKRPGITRRNIKGKPHIIVSPYLTRKSMQCIVSRLPRVEDYRRRVRELKTIEQSRSVGLSPSVTVGS